MRRFESFRSIHHLCAWTQTFALSAASNRVAKIAASTRPACGARYDRDKPQKTTFDLARVEARQQD
jgi:hypothetical protein